MLTHPNWVVANKWSVVSADAAVPDRQHFGVSDSGNRWMLPPANPGRIESSIYSSSRETRQIMTVLEP